MASHMYLFVSLSLVVCTYGEQSYDVKSKDGNSKEDSDIYVYPAGFRGGRYYYGGIYRGSCHNDGLYYRDGSSFVICSNGNAYVQPCAPGTKSSGQHRYSPGYYYGYSDFCDINLVDQGYGPAHYAPYGVRVGDGEESGYSTDDGYNQKKSTSYGTDHSYGKGNDPYDYRNKGYSSYGRDSDNYDKANDLYGANSKAYSKDVYPKSQSYSQQPKAVKYDPYGKKDYAQESKY